MKRDGNLKAWTLVYITCLALLLCTTRTWAQGSLTPPGPPGPTMKALAEIEPRTPITNIPYVINTPGSYYLIDNLVGSAGMTGVFIKADYVSLDLNGFALIGLPGSIEAIRDEGSLVGLQIFNGSIQGWGTNGVGLYNSSGIFKNLNVISNAGGMIVGSPSLVVDCVFQGNTGNGLFINNGGSTVKRCTAQGNGGLGLGGPNRMIISECIAEGNGWHGLQAGNRSVIVDSLAIMNGAVGVFNGGSGTIESTIAIGNGDDGIYAGVNSTVRGCTSQNNTNNGILGASGVYEQNTCSGNTGSGIQIEQGTVKNNFCSDNGTNGITVLASGTVSFNTSSTNNSDGINVGGPATLMGNTCVRNGDDGMQIEGPATIKDNTCAQNRYGIYSTGPRNQIFGNTIAESVINGILFGGSSSNNFVGRNVIAGNPIPFNSAPNNQTGTFGNVNIILP